MLKIKDNVDLKDLEKFGFKFIENMFMQRYKKGNLVIYINNCGKKEEYNKLLMQPLIEKVIYTRTYHNNEDLHADIDNVLFDLIQAGLVEKR